ncbi:hypothetical protein C1645_824983 [Glomus cerebriforme]|uniref:SWIM-type domain-containing protein n=1 Tax=Glomus cerebriforme TaxID=658196 RepID=A0A397SZD8_9GLOM|nr:hypothetical protein C1645_824983 [Glomus cerebriforme]
MYGEKNNHVEYNNYSSLYLHVLSDKSTQFAPKVYVIQLLPKIQCQCMDFLSRGGACKHLRASVLWINWLRLQSPQLQYQFLDHRSLPYILLPSQDNAIKEAKNSQNESIFLETKSQYIKEKEINNNAIQNNTEISTSSSSHTRSPQPNETTLTDSLHIKQDAAIWKQEYIVSATNILANLNEIEFITRNIKQLFENIPDGIDDEAENLNKKMKVILERINDNEDVRKLKDITNKVWKERSQTKKKTNIC